MKKSLCLGVSMLAVAASVSTTATGEPGGYNDAMVRDTLAKNGDDGRIPRLTTFFFYDGDLAGLRAAASSAGYQVKPSDYNDGITLEAVISVDEGSFKPHSMRMEAWAKEFGSEYDGWECDVVKNRKEP